MDNYFLKLKKKIKHITDSQNNKKLELYNRIHRDNKLSSYEGLEKHFNNLLSKFYVDKVTDIKDYNIKEIIINQYEESKDNVTIGVLNKKEKDSYLVSIIIFDSDEIYENLLLKKFNNDIDSNLYFMELKTFIMKNNLEEFSKKIVQKL